MMRIPTIETKALSVGYPTKNYESTALHTDLNLTLFAGEVTCLLGLNGAGKSTLLRTLCGFQPALSGKINLIGQPIHEYSKRRLSLTLGVVLTEKTNAGGLTVKELVSLGRYPHTGFFGRLNKIDEEVVEKAMNDVGISHKSEQFVAQLSDGERQKAMIAKVLAQECQVILLDEPTAFLDVTARIETMALLHNVATKQQKSILLSTHDLDLAIQMGDKLWLLQREKPVTSGSPEELVLNGSFDYFFDRKGLLFDSSTGKLSIERSLVPISVSGNERLAFWMSNALLRHGYKPIENGKTNLSVVCISDDKYELNLPNNSVQIANSINGLIHLLTQSAD